MEFVGAGSARSSGTDGGGGVTATIHINRPSSIRFQARVRYRGQWRWVLVGKSTRRKDRAIVAMAKKFASGHYKRGEVLMAADYYDPIVVCEMVRP